MVDTNGGTAPFLVAGGGIGGLATAYALAHQGFPVRVFEQSTEFREVGAGIQLGPNIFRVLEKIGLKDAMLADAHRPPAQEMRDALTGKLITRIPLGAEFSERFGQPYAVTHRADIHGTFLKACQGSNLITLETSRRVDGFEDHGDGVTVTLENGERVEGCALIGCDGMWSEIRERDHRRRQAARVGPHRLSRRAQARGGAGRPVAAGRGAVGRPAHPFRALPAAPGRALQPRRGVPFRPLRGRLERGRQHRRCSGSISRASARRSCACSSASTPGACGCCATASR